MDAAVRGWFEHLTSHASDWPAARLLAAKGSTTVSVVLPALNEATTVGRIVERIRRELVERRPLVDELVVVDSGSTDTTIRVAAAAGAKVVHRDTILPRIPAVPGKGEVLWRSLAATDGDVICFIDSDLVDFDAGFVPALLGPLLLQRRSRRVALVKGFYRRPLRIESAEVGTGGGRVTELLARPLLNALRPELAGVVQPLGGEYAATREFLESVPFAAGYGVEIGLLLDAHTRYGLDGLAQVNLGVRKHRNRSLLELGVMSRQILGAALPRCGVAEVAGSAGITQFVQLGARFLPTESDVLVADRPPMRDVLAARSA